MVVNHVAGGLGGWGLLRDNIVPYHIHAIPNERPAMEWVASP